MHNAAFHIGRIALALLITSASLCAASSKLTISPGNPRQLKNSTLQFTASLNGEPLNGPVEWISSNTAVATISGSRGRATATLLNVGTTTITAIRGGRKSQTTLTVTTATNPTFISQPTDTNVSAVIDASGGVKAQLLDNLGDPLPGQSITVVIDTNPPGMGTLSGTLTQITDASGTATFPDLKIDWLGSGYTLVASASPTSGPVSGTSTTFNELRVGDICLGPDTPACQGTCPDADGDGLNDAWETAGGVDLNGDGVITDSAHDLLLAGADPAKPDIYVHYDWMDYGGLDYQCTADADCPQFGATCTGPAIPGSAKSCVQQCQADVDCQALGEAHGSDRCVASVCQHTHDPDALTAGALDAVAARFASHGINLHIERGQALPHSHVVSFRLLSDPQDPSKEMTDGCEGGSVASGTAGLGNYAESYYDLKSRYFDYKKSSAYHYIVFGHYSGCDTYAHCQNDAHTGACPLAGACGTVQLGQTGTSEINGNDFIVSLGNTINDNEAFLIAVAPGGAPIGQFIIGGTFMHELGHNLGLRHGGGVSATNDPASCYPPDCEDECTNPSEPNFKPNFLSVMNYRYQTHGIQSAGAPGDSLPVDTRLDYSTQVLPTVPVSDGVAGVLDECNLDETVAYGLTSGNADLFSYTDGTCAGHSAWPTHGPVDWDGSRVAGDNPGAMADLNSQANLGTCVTPTEKHRGHVDWGPGPGQSIFRYGFQCTTFADNHPLSPGSRAAKPQITVMANIMSAVTPGGELTADIARKAHVLYPTAAAGMVIRPGCKATGKPIAPGQSGAFTVALMGADRFDVNKVDLSSLRFHGAASLSTSVTDVDGDGKPDLLITFDMADVKLDPKATAARLTGWLKNSQNFVGEDKIRVVSSLAPEDPSCR